MYSGNEFKSDTRYESNNLVNQVNDNFNNNVFNGKKRSVRSSEKPQMESENGDKQNGMRSMGDDSERRMDNGVMMINNNIVTQANQDNTRKGK